MTPSSMVRYFIVGAPKCASTSLYDLFEADPAYAVTAIKETHHFSAEDVERGQYDDVPIVRSEQDYDNQFQGTGTRIDICPSYFASQAAIRRIHEHNPDARILILVREPIKRAISHFKMDVSLGYSEDGSFEAIWRKGAGPQFEEYFGISRYQDWINRWIEAFGQDQVFLVNLIDQPLSASRVTLETFLERPLTTDQLPVSNVAKTYNIPLPMLRKLGILKLADKFMPTSVRDMIKRMVPRKPPVKVDVSDALAAELAEYYRAEYKLLSEL